MRTFYRTAKPLLVLFFCCIFISVTFSQDTTTGHNNYLVNLDWNRFRAQDSLTYLEFNGSVSRNLLTFEQKDGQYAGEFIVDARVLKEDSLVRHKIWRNIDQIDSLIEMDSDRMLYFVNYFILTPGDYTLSLDIFDAVDTSRSVSHALSVPVPGFSNALQISDVQLASRIEHTDQKGAFVKNGFRVFPNSSGIYGLKVPILYTYAEIYNLSQSDDAKADTYSVKYTVYDTDGRKMKTPSPRVHKKPGSSAVAINQITVTNLHSGAYLLNTKIHDHDSKDSISVNRKFYVYREDDFSDSLETTAQTSASTGFFASHYSQMTEKELDQEFEYTKHINTRKDRRTWKKLSFQEKREFLPAFWTEMDRTPDTPLNEFKREYMKRVHMANTLYRGNFENGWETDRGRVLILYGEPDDIERESIVGVEREYHIWHYYDILGGVIFIFVDKRDLGDLELVHSDAPNEIYDPEWQRWLER